MSEHLKKHILPSLINHGFPDALICTKPGTRIYVFCIPLILLALDKYHLFWKAFLVPKSLVHTDKHYLYV